MKYDPDEIPFPDPATPTLDELAQGKGWSNAARAKEAAALLREMASTRELKDEFAKQEDALKAKLSKLFQDAAAAGDAPKVKGPGFAASGFTTKRSTLDKKTLRIALHQRGVPAPTLEEAFAEATKESESYTFQFRPEKKK